MDFSDLLIVTGLTTLTYGISLLDFPLALIVLGSIILAAGVWGIFHRWE